MPDKYSYKASKKKKAARRPVATQPVSTEDKIEAELTPTSDFHPIVEIKPAIAARSGAATKPAAAPSESRGISQAGNLGAEMRRFVVIAGVVIVALVASALILI
jgi:hypothetical protein